MRGLAIFAALLVLAPQSPALAKVDNHYAKWKLGQPYGYRDLKVSPGRWKIRSLSYHAGMNFTVAQALHRLAVHAKAEGFDSFFTASMKVHCSNLFAGAPAGCVGTSLDEEVDAIAVGLNHADQLPPCEEKGVWAENCRRYAVDEVLDELRAPLGLTAEQDAQEIAAARPSRNSG